jgi:Tol biopolymer transport system component
MTLEARRASYRRQLLRFVVVPVATFVSALSLFAPAASAVLSDDIELVSTTYPGDARIHTLQPAVWSPDGSRIVFGGQTSDPNSPTADQPYELYLADLSNGAVTLLTTAEPGQPLPTQVQPGPTWSPDGGQIGFRVYSAGRFHGYIKDLVSGTLTALTGTGETCDGTLGQPMWSPDDSSYAAGLNEGTFNSAGICVVDRRSGQAALVSTREDGHPADSVSGDPVWSPDSTRIAFVSYDINLIPGLSQSPARHIFIKDLKTGRLSAIRTDVPFVGVLEGPTWNADGTRLAFVTNSPLVASDTNGAPDVYVANTSTGAVSLVTQASDGNASNGSTNGGEGMMWSPTDPNALAFISTATNLLAGVTVPPGLNGGGHLTHERRDRHAARDRPGERDGVRERLTSQSVVEPRRQLDRLRICRIGSDARHLRTPGLRPEAQYGRANLDQRPGLDDTGVGRSVPG